MTRISLAVDINYITETLKLCQIKVLFNFALLNFKLEGVKDGDYLKTR